MNGVLLELLSASRERRVAVTTGGAVESTRPSLLAALRGRQQVKLLAEFKRCSPSDAQLAPGTDLIAQVSGYEQAGAAGLSVLTEPTRFRGSLGDLGAAVAATTLPVLRKDFLVRPEQVQESVAHGASAVLLIARCLPGSQLAELADACAQCQAEMLIECHDEADLERALPFSEAMLGINNRDLDTLQLDRDVFLRLARLVPKERVVVAESGYTDPAQLRELHGLADAVLIGTALMRGPSSVARAAAFANGGQS
ncbi:MAG TPA: indole-3-glycerol-phosphate synthase [Planctomycetes bacterium]|nr:indole-3-glycerol-phosphate synthase [Planctomycetota bacterium]